jgi:hypothetical protein
MGKPRIDDFKQVLFVEGDSDLHFYKALLRSRFDLEVFIRNCQGRDQTKKTLELDVKPSFLAEKSHLAVIVDADHDARAPSDSFTNLLEKLTGQKVVAGRWTAGQPRVGLWIAPDGKNAGEIETLVWQAWSSNSSNAKPKACIESFVACMAKTGCHAKSPDKALVGSLLAVCNDDDPRLGPGARAGVFDFESPAFAPLLEFLKGFRS